MGAGLAALRCEQATIDGVLVALDPAGKPDRAALERALSVPDSAVAFYAFDLLAWEGFDLRPLPLFDRKAALRTLVPPHEGVLYVDHVAANGPALLHAIVDAGLPAAIAKRGASPYRDGESDDWRRVPADSPFAVLPAGQNLVRIRTDLQDAAPLLLGGPGAGPEVTAAGLLSDIVAAARELAGPRARD